MIDPIAKFHSPGGTLISVYVNRRMPGTRALLVDLLRQIQDRPRDRTAEKVVRADVARLVDHASKIESEQAPAVAMFISGSDGIFEYLPLTHGVDPVASVGPRPMLRPLRSRQRPLRVGVVVADTTTAKTFVSAGESFREVGDVLTTDPGKDNFGGFAGYEEHRIRGRADEMAAKLWRDAGKRLLDIHQDQPFDLMVVGGHDEHLDAVLGQFHPYLKALPAGRMVVDSHTATEHDLAGQVARCVDEERSRRSQELLDQLLSVRDRGGDAVSGLADVLQASNAHAIDQLVVAGPFSKPGVICDSCGWLGRMAGECPVCTGEVFELDDVVSAVMDATVEAGGRVNVVDLASRLDVDGVGALLRFSLG